MLMILFSDTVCFFLLPIEKGKNEYSCNIPNIYAPENGAKCINILSLNFISSFFGNTARSLIKEKVEKEPSK